MESKVVFLGRWLINFMHRVLRRLGFFPFTFLYVGLSAALKVVQLRRGHKLLHVGEVTGKAGSLPHSVMLWLDRIMAGPPGYQYDVCLLLPREAADANLNEVFSVVMTFPRLRSVGFYWDASSLADDLPLLQAKQDRNGSTDWTAPYEDLGSFGVKQFEEFFQANHAGIALPVAATRDAQTLLKRLAGGAYAVCLSVPAELRALADALVAARPDVWFFDLSPALPTRKGGNIHSLHDYGLNLHERMAVVQSADAYVGSFDELGCAALVARHPAVLFGCGTGRLPDRISRGDKVIWFPDPVEQTMAAKMVLQFLSSQLEPTGE